MKRIKMTLLIAFMMMTGVSVGQTEQIRRDAALYMADSLKLDSMIDECVCLPTRGNIP